MGRGEGWGRRWWRLGKIEFDYFLVGAGGEEERLGNRLRLLVVLVGMGKGWGRR